jgi:uncharacterized protein (TIGR02001 family)
VAWRRVHAPGAGREFRRPEALRAVAFGGLLISLFAPVAASAQLSGYAALSSDYRYRGESLSDRQPAVQAGIDYQHSSGIFLGGQVSTVRVDVGALGLGGQFYAGYARALTELVSWEAGLLTYVFSGDTDAASYYSTHGSIYNNQGNYTEGFVGATYQDINARAYYTDNYFGAGGRAAYLEINVTRQLTAHIVLLGHLGYLGYQEPGSYGGPGKDRSLFDFRVGLGVELSGFTLELSVVGTIASGSACPAGTGNCSTTAVISVSKSFR